MSDSKKLFTQMVQQSGMPTTEKGMQDEWKRINEAQGSKIANDSAFSPFWRLITAIATTPCLWLRDLLITTALPNLFLKYAGGMWLDTYAWGVDLKRKAAKYAEGQLTVTRTNAAGALFIPAGTVIESPAIAGYVYRVVTTGDNTIPDGQLTAKISVKAEQTGTAYNLGAGYYSILQKPLPGIASIRNEADWLQVPGADVEQDEPLRMRCRNQFSAVGQYHHDAAYKAEISTFAGVRPDYLFFAHNKPRGAGSANCYVMIESGAPTQAFIDDINGFIRDSGNHGHGDDMLCFPIPVTQVALTVTVTPSDHLPSEQKEQLKHKVEDMVRCAFRENTNFKITKVYPFSRFSFSRLSEELHADLFDLKSVEFNHGVSNLDIQSTMNLPLLSSLTMQDGA